MVTVKRTGTTETTVTDSTDRGGGRRVGATVINDLLEYILVKDQG